jgi:hypothetical protein
VLGRNSPVEALRTRLKELRKLGISDAAIYGTKQQLRERLLKCEVLLGEKVRLNKAIEDRQQRIQDGVEPELPKALKIPEKPDQQTVQMNELTHAKFEPLCLACVLGKGAAAPHSTQHITGREAEVPVIQTDHHYLKDDGEDAKEVEERFSTTLAAVDCDTGVPLQLSLPSKSGNQDYAITCLVSFMKRLGG